MFSIYESIIGCLEAHGKSIEDIEWVGSNDFSIPLDNFLKLATTTEENEWEDDVPCDLVIVGNDFGLSVGMRVVVLFTHGGSSSSFPKSLPRNIKSRL